MAEVTTPLATAAQLTQLGYTGLTDEIIARASARIRGYTRQSISRVVDDVVDLPAADPLLLPQRPVVSVASVQQLLDDGSLTDLPAAGWRLRNNRIEGLSCRAVWPYLNLPVWVRVTYTHGYQPLPQALLDLLGAIAQRLSLLDPLLETGVVRSETRSVDDYTETTGYADGPAQSAGDLFESEKRALDRLLGARRYGSVPL